MANYGISYLGSKDAIIHKLAPLFPKADNFYDLFGGGFAVSHFMVLHKATNYKKISYNEIKTDIVELVRDAIAGKYNYDVFKPKWISRDEFDKNKTHCAYTRCLWSFGNNQKDYLFSEANEKNKKSLHNAVVFNEFDDLAKSFLNLDSFLPHLSIRGRRLLCRNIIMERIGEIEQLQHLLQLERLQRLQRLEFSSKSYDEIEILPNSVVYCDPPYKGTTGYLSSFDHDRFWNWVRRQNNPVFVSEYEAPQDIKTIAAFNKKTRLSAKGMTDTKPEKLFGNDAANLTAHKPDLVYSFREPAPKADVILKEPNLTLCPNCKVIIETENNHHSPPKPKTRLNKLF